VTAPAGITKLPAAMTDLTSRMLSRRAFVASTLAAAALRPASAFAEAEPFPVRASDAKEVPYKFRRQEVEFNTNEQPGTIVVDPRRRFLFHVQGGGKAIRYGASVGKAGRTWSGQAVIKRKEKWPTWTPTPEHIAEFPKLVKYLPNGMPGGLDNPMGARALYLYQGDVDTIYRIHGTHSPKLIGQKKTAGCFGLLNIDIIHLYDQVPLGTRVVVLPY
jgi:lipoprotein-anchoring transpeptidase ErfK/SrfK